jgi:hypothetical protein
MELVEDGKICKSKIKKYACFMVTPAKYQQSTSKYGLNTSKTTNTSKFPETLYFYIFSDS